MMSGNADIRIILLKHFETDLFEALRVKIYILHQVKFEVLFSTVKTTWSTQNSQTENVALV